MRQQLGQAPSHLLGRSRLLLVFPQTQFWLDQRTRKHQMIMGQGDDVAPALKLLWGTQARFLPQQRLLVQTGLARTSWTAPLKVQRLKPDDNVNLVAVEQIKTLLQECPASEPLPIFVFDAGYESVQVAQAWGTLHAAALIRLRSGRCFYADPAEQAATGRPPRHGHTFACADPTTWLTPDQDSTTEDSQYGQVHVRAWHTLHTIPQNHAKRGTRGPRPLMRGTLIQVSVSRLPKRTRDPKPLWFWWHAPEPPVLARVWRAYVSRFDLEHTFRFVKHILNWTVPRVRHPEQADRWTWLVILASTQLRLARPVVADHRLPWERPLAEGKMTPYRVRRAFPSCAADTSQRSQTYRNPVDGHLDGPKVVFLAMPHAILPSKESLKLCFPSLSRLYDCHCQLSVIPSWLAS